MEHTRAQRASPPQPAAPPLHVTLSQSLVAFIIEFDNEFEHRMPHRTTRHGSTGSLPHPPWLVSMAMWAHCMRHVPPDGIRAGDLTRRSGLTARSMQIVVKRMSAWWGYLSVVPDPADARAKPPPSAWLVRPTPAGRQAQEVWAPLGGAVEDRWHDRFGRDTIERLCTALHGVAGQLETALPDFMPVGEPRRDGRPASDDDDSDGPAVPALPALMSKVLLAFGIGFERESGLSLGPYTANGLARLAISANVLRVLDEQGVRATDVPALSGVAKMTVDNWLGSLEKHRYLTIGRGPDGGRFKVARLTARGRQAQDAYWRWAADAERRMEDRVGAKAVGTLRGAVGPLLADGLLWQGTEPYPDGWRAQVPKPATLPHYPVISFGGGFPDGS